jgi:hypothetical protein
VSEKPTVNVKQLWRFGQVAFSVISGVIGYVGIQLSPSLNQQAKAWAVLLSLFPLGFVIHKYFQANKNSRISSPFPGSGASILIAVFFFAALQFSLKYTDDNPVESDLGNILIDIGIICLFALFFASLTYALSSNLAKILFDYKVAGGSIKLLSETGDQENGNGP